MVAGGMRSRLPERPLLLKLKKRTSPLVELLTPSSKWIPLEEPVLGPDFLVKRELHLVRRPKSMDVGMKIAYKVKPGTDWSTGRLARKRGKL